MALGTLLNLATIVASLFASAVAAVGHPTGSTTLHLPRMHPMLALSAPVSTRMPSPQA